MVIVLHFPPGSRETLPDVSDTQPSKIVIEAISKHVMMKKVVGKPSTLLPEESEKNTAYYAPVMPLSTLMAAIAAASIAAFDTTLKA